MLQEIDHFPMWQYLTKCTIFFYFTNVLELKTKYLT